MQLTPTQAQHAFVPLVALTMSGLMSLALTAFNVGVGVRLLSLWPQQWFIGFAVALPTALLVVPFIRNGLARVTVPPTPRLPSPIGTEPVTRALIP